VASWQDISNLGTSGEGDKLIVDFVGKYETLELSDSAMNSEINNFRPEARLATLLA
jgi:hypothetical protein